MLNSGSPDTNSSRFAILFKPTPSFNGCEAVEAQRRKTLTLHKPRSSALCLRVVLDFAEKTQSSAKW